MLPSDDQGTGTSAVVLLHAGIADRTMWTELREDLAGSHRRVVAVDLPGYGEAPAPTQRDAPWSDVLDTLDGLGIERLVLVGCSYGAAVALRVAALAPGRTAGLLLCSTPVEDVAISDELAAAWEAEEAALAAGDIGAAVDVVLEAWLLPDAPAELRQRIAAAQRRAFVAQRQAAAPAAVPDPLAESPAALERLDAPILVVAGGRDRREFHDGAELLARRLPGAQLAVISAAGHLPPLEAPGEFGALIDGLLSRVDDAERERSASEPADAPTP